MPATKADVVFLHQNANDRYSPIFKSIVSEEYANCIKEKKTSFTITCIGAGPAKEALEFLRDIELNVDCRIFVNILDHEYHTLNTIEQEIAKLKLRNRNFSINYTKTNFVLTCLSETRGRNVIFACDFLVSHVPFDHLKKSVFQKITTVLSNSLKENGSLIIRNMHDFHRDVTIMGEYLDHKTASRTKEEMMAIVDHNSIIKNAVVSVGTDENEVKLQQYLRVDIF